MATEKDLSNIMTDLQNHIRIAKLPIDNLSSLAQKGDERLVEQFMTENIEISGTGSDALQSQFYVASFWGCKDIVKQLIDKGADVNAQNRGTLWTSLHAATFQEHGPVVMLLLQHDAQPELPDSEGRTATDFASASDKVWPHFAAMSLRRTSKKELIDKCIIKKMELNAISPKTSPRQPGDGIRMASYSRPESAYAMNADPLMAAMSGDVLADQPAGENTSPRQGQPQFAMWK